MEKFRYPIALFLVSIMLQMVDSLLRLLHLPGEQILSVCIFIIQVRVILWVMPLTKFRYLIMLFLSGFILLRVGLMFKILHWPGGEWISVSMLIVQIISITSIIVLLLRPKGNPCL